MELHDMPYMTDVKPCLSCLADVLRSIEQYSHVQSTPLYTVESRYLKLGYLKFCKVRSVFMNQKYILIAFSNHNLAFETFYKSKLPKVQINLHFR